MDFEKNSGCPQSKWTAAGYINMGIIQDYISRFSGSG
jgi:hypothetical protein